MRDTAGTQHQRLLGIGAELRRSRDEMFFPLRGRIVDVIAIDSPKNQTGTTLVDVAVGSVFTTVLPRVPLIRAKAGAAGGEDWSPEVGDHVAVGFFEGQWKDPVVLGFIPAPGNMVEAKGEAAPRYYRAHQGTTETVEKTGRRVVHVAEDDVLEVVGNGTVTLGGNLTVTIQGNATITASGTVNVDGSVINLGGAGVHRLIDERLIDLYNNHRHGSSTVPSIALSLESVATSTTKAT